MRRRYDLADANHDPDGSKIHARDESRLPREHGRRVPPERNFDPYEDYSDRAQQMADARDPGGATW